MGKARVPGRAMKSLDFIKKIFTNEYLSLAFRLYIGGIFIYASMYKINYPGEFAETIASYQLVPFWAVNISALVMPWMELICGFLLIAGIRAKSATVVIGGMLVLFIAAITVNLLRGTPIGCGCFHTIEDQMDWTTLVRDLVWLAMTVHIYFFDSAVQLERKFLMSIKDL